MAPKILFSPKQPDNIMQIVRELAPPGFDLVPVDPGTPQFIEAAQDAEYYMGLARQMGGEFFRSAPKLKLVQLLSAGYDRVDIEAARKAKVPVSNNGGANAIAVAEHTLTLILAVLKRIVKFHNDVVAGKWRVGGPTDQPVYELAGRTLGIVGLGNIGKKVARRAAAFDANVLYYDIARLPEYQEDALGVRFALFTELVQKADILSLHCNLDASNRGLIGRAAFAKMRRHPRLVNVARGGLVVEADLVEALDAGQVSGAALDVLAEDSPDLGHHPLVGRGDVILTPHVAFYSEAALDDLRRISAANITAFLEGRPQDVFRLVPAP